MNKFFKKFAPGFLGILLFLSTAGNTYASFSDVSSYNKYFDAITYLQENGIIQGYGDGTFKPFQTVNRAEFLKIIIEGSHLNNNITSTNPFSDIPQNAWYTTYVNTAFASGWINGYQDGTFKPEQTISKVEALKILGKAQNWQISQTVTEEIYTDTSNDSWYIGYVKYAKDHGYLEEQGPLFSPLSLMTRGQISEIIFRSLTLSSPPSPTDATPDTTPDTTTNTETNTFFDNITLNEDLPEAFFTHEIYQLSGQINDPDSKTINAIIENTKSQTREIFSAPIENKNFTLPVIFDNSGTYKIGLISNSQSNSKAIQVIVSDSTLAPSNTEPAPEKPKNLSLSFENDTTKLNYSGSSENTIKKLTFTQGNTSKTFISRQNLTSIPLPYRAFSSFHEGSMQVYLEIAQSSDTNPITVSSPFTKSDSLTFTSTEHTFDMIEADQISTTAPDTKTTLSTISFTGSVTTDIETKAFIIKANGLTDTTQLTTTGKTGEYFGSPIIKSGSNFTFSYTPPTLGRYIIAIDNKGGEPIFSHPIYIGTSIPLIPDFFDKNQREFFTGNLDLKTSRTNLLDLINADRQKYGLSLLTLDTDLNSLAQDHSDDMASKNYFAHVNPSNQTPDDRRIATGISTPVGENLALDVSIEFTHYSLMRSPSHRINILKSDWTRVGLGITKQDGYLYITEEFSTNPFTASDLTDFKTELLAAINQKRTDNSDDILTYSVPLENAAIYLNNNIKDNPSNFTQQLFEEALSNNEVQGSSEVTTITSGSWSDTLDSIINDQSNLFDSLWEFIGIDIDTDNEGLLHTILIINQ